MIKESCFGFSACLPSFVPKLWFVFFYTQVREKGGGVSNTCPAARNDTNIFSREGV